MQDQRFETLEARMPDINEPELMDLLGHDAEARMYLCLINTLMTKPRSGLKQSLGLGVLRDGYVTLAKYSDMMVIVYPEFGSDKYKNLLRSTLVADVSIQMITQYYSNLGEYKNRSVKALRRGVKRTMKIENLVTELLGKYNVVCDNHGGNTQISNLLLYLTQPRLYARIADTISCRDTRDARFACLLNAALFHERETRHSSSGSNNRGYNRSRGDNIYSRLFVTAERIKEFWEGSLIGSSNGSPIYETECADSKGIIAKKVFSCSEEMILEGLLFEERLLKAARTEEEK